MDDNAFQPIDLSPELARKQRAEDLKSFRKLDKRMNVFKSEFENPLLDLNTRLIQYKMQFQMFSIEYLIIQTVQDFNRFVSPLQTKWKKLDRFKPVFMYKGEMYFVNHQNQFTKEKTVKVLGS